MRLMIHTDGFQFALLNEIEMACTPQWLAHSLKKMLEL